jgi:hypothetical protein
VLLEHRDFLDRMSEILIATEVVDGKDLKEYFEGTRPIPTSEELERISANNGRRQPPSGPEIAISGLPPVPPMPDP